MTSLFTRVFAAFAAPLDSATSTLEHVEVEHGWVHHPPSKCQRVLIIGCVQIGAFAGAPCGRYRPRRRRIAPALHICLCTTGTGIHSTHHSWQTKLATVAQTSDKEMVAHVCVLTTQWSNSAFEGQLRNCLGVTNGSGQRVGDLAWENAELGAAALAKPFASTWATAQSVPAPSTAETERTAAGGTSQSAPAVEHLSATFAAETERELLCGAHAGWLSCICAHSVRAGE